MAITKTIKSGKCAATPCSPCTESGCHHHGTVAVRIRVYNSNDALDDAQDVYLNSVKIGTYHGIGAPAEDDTFTGNAGHGCNELLGVVTQVNNNGNAYDITITDVSTGAVYYSVILGSFTTVPIQFNIP